jgi:Cytochrome c.
VKRRAWLPWLIGLLAALAGGTAWLWHAASPESPVAVGDVSQETLRDPALIARGSYLASVGDCAGCHTARGGAAFAGGRMVPTPFGNIPAPNLTPDPATGLGQWRFGDFWQAIHVGRGRHGELLYPAFPYTSYTRLTRGDALAIFAYLQSLPAVHQPPRRRRCVFPTACAPASSPGGRCISGRASTGPTRARPRSGTAAPTWCRGRGTATNATRHAMRSAPPRPAPS